MRPPSRRSATQPACANESFGCGTRVLNAARLRFPVIHRLLDSPHLEPMTNRIGTFPADDTHCAHDAAVAPLEVGADGVRHPRAWPLRRFYFLLSHLHVGFRRAVRPTGAAAHAIGGERILCTENVILSAVQPPPKAELNIGSCCRLLRGDKPDQNDDNPAAARVWENPQ